MGELQSKKTRILILPLFRVFDASMQKYSDQQARGSCGAQVASQVQDRSSNDEVERRGGAATQTEADLSRSSTPSFGYRRRNPRSLEPLVSWLCAIPREARGAKFSQAARPSARCTHVTQR